MKNRVIHTLIWVIMKRFYHKNKDFDCPRPILVQITVKHISYIYLLCPQ